MPRDAVRFRSPHLRATRPPRTFVAMLCRASRALGLATVAFATLLPACDRRESLPDIEYVVFDAHGDSPLTGRSLTVARAYFIQDVPGAVEDSSESPVVDGTFDVIVPIDDVSVPIQVRLELARDTGVELIGGTPSYYPSQATTVGVIVGEPGTCDAIDGLTIGNARASSGVSVNGTFVLISGGIGADSGGAKSMVDVDAIDLLSFRQYHLTDSPTALGATRSAAIDGLASVVLPTDGSPYVHRVYAAGGTEPRPTITLHAGATSADVAMHVPGIGAVVIGGGSDASPSAELSWVFSAGASSANAVRTASLHAAEPDRTATVAANGVWILSRGAGATTLEQAFDTATAPTLRLDGIADGVRRGGLLFANSAGTDLFILGGVDENGALRTDTVAISGCPTACVANPGPAWANARTGFATDGSAFVVGGTVSGVLSPLVERVRFGAAGFSIEAVAQLAVPRRDAGLVRLPTGSVYVLGGTDASGPRNDVEICFATP